MNYWLLALLVLTNGVMLFYIFRAASLSARLKDAKRRIRILKRPEPFSFQRPPDGEMMALLKASPLKGLRRYAVVRLYMSKQEEHALPPTDCDLAALCEAKVTTVKFDRDVPRTQMVNHAGRIRAGFRGQPEICALNAICIAYLRRRTPHTDHARALFLRIWREHGAFLAEQISTRWLISTLLTFMDYGENTRQRTIGAAGISFGNTLKMYEWERLVMGLDPSAPYPEDRKAEVYSSFHDIGGLSLKRADIFRNTLSILVDLSLREKVAGRVLLTLLIRLHDAPTIFNRTDHEKMIADESFFDPGVSARHWSYGDPPPDTANDT